MKTTGVQSLRKELDQKAIEISNLALQLGLTEDALAASCVRTEQAEAALAFHVKRAEEAEAQLAALTEEVETQRIANDALINHCQAAEAELDKTCHCRWDREHPQEDPVKECGYHASIRHGWEQAEAQLAQVREVLATGGWQSPTHDYLIGNLNALVKMHEDVTTQRIANDALSNHCRAAEAHIQQLAAALREAEWSPVVEGHCPSCGRSEVGGHAKGCRLAAALIPPPAQEVKDLLKINVPNALQTNPGDENY